MKEIVQTKLIIMPLRIEVCNRIKNITTINTKKTRPVFVNRENPDTPPAITDSVRETASLMRNANSLIAHFKHPDPDLWIIANYNDAPIFEKIHGKIPTADTPRPLWMCEAAPANGKNFGRIYTAESNVNTNDKPAFRHDSLFLFDTLSEEY